MGKGLWAAIIVVILAVIVWGWTSLAREESIPTPLPLEAYYDEAIGDAGCGN